MSNKRLFIVSNRLPVNITVEDESISVKPASGGLVTSLESYLSRNKGSRNDYNETYWLGVPGCTKAAWKRAETELMNSTYNYVPVFIPKDTYDKYYNGFANSLIWPLFHYIPSFAEYNIDHYENYIAANQIFADTIVKYARPGDHVWIHDYHLMPLAHLIREAVPGITIGFFLHIPFPSYELFRMIPKKWQNDILKGILGADLVGFHTIDYTQHFLQCVQMILGLENDMHMIRYNNRLIKADVFPVSIDFDKFYNAYDDEKTRVRREELLKNFKDKKIIFSVDRLDYTKGVSNRLQGYENFLQTYPEYQGKVVFIMVVVPSREYITKYAERKKMIDEMIGNINSKLGTIEWQPVIYQYTSLDFYEMVGLYTACDLALITPLRDGMNLVAKEFAASRKDGKGVLLLSEMAGAARELTSSIMINPNDVTEIAEKILFALEMPEKEQNERILAMQTRISQYDVNVWASDFLTQLEHIKLRQDDYKVKFLDELEKNNLIYQYDKSSKRLILLDYDGTLVPYSLLPSKAKPGEALIEVLQKLAQDPRNHVYLISGRNSSILEKWFAEVPINLIAEHGAKIRLRDGDWRTLVEVEDSWKPQIEKSMQQYVTKCANTFIEEKEFSIVWHYRNANPDEARLRAMELFAELSEYSKHFGLQVVRGNKIIEVKVTGADKGSIIKREIATDDFEFVLGAGDDLTDEDMFKVLGTIDHAFTIKIGSEASFAKFNLLTPHMMVSLLETLAHLASMAARQKKDPINF
jgi:trehalose 6-phosphate synthase/phosphatase